MRTTVTLYPDVAAKAKKGAAQLGKPFKEIVNEALRIGLDKIMQPPTTKPYRTRPHSMGLRPGLSYDNTGELLARADAEAGAFGSVSEHIRQLIRRRREAKIGEDVAMLEKAIAGAPAGDPRKGKMRRIYAVAKKGRRS